MINYLEDKEIMIILKKYINMEKPEYAILIDGPWGSGKTYFINNIFSKHLQKEKQEFSRISLYGITEKKEIDNKITESILESSHPKYGKLLANTFNNIGNLSNLINNTIPRPITKVIGKINIKNLLSKLQDIDNHIIIFDDLERCNLEIKVILGYINEYLENKNNKIIIVANQKEIFKSKQMNNIELKYLTVKPYNKNVYSQSEINGIQYAFNHTKDYLKDNIEKTTLDKRIMDLFSEEIVYKEIKEKVIGKEIYYSPNIELICKNLSKKLNCNLSKKILNNNAKEIAEKMISKNHFNIRTLKLVIVKFEEIVDGLNEYDIKEDNDYEKILKSILLYLLEAYILKKKKDEIYKWIGNAEYDLQYGIHKFRFIDEMIITENINYESINTCLKEYSKEIKSDIESNHNDPIYILKNHYTEIEDEEILEYSNQIYNKLEKKEYDKSNYPKIIYVLLIIKTLDLKDFEINKYINIMEKNLQEISQEHNFENEFFYNGFNIYDEKIRKEYEQFVKKFEQISDTTVSVKIRESINNIIKEKENWGQDLKSYFSTSNPYRHNTKLFLALDVNNLIEVFKISKAKDIAAFRDVILTIDISQDEVTPVKSLIIELEKLVQTEQRKTQKLNFEYLIDNLKEKLKYIGS